MFIYQILHHFLSPNVNEYFRMQQLYRCWSWWETHPDLPSVVLWRYQSFHNGVTDTFVRLLKWHYSLDVINEYTDEFVMQSVRSKDTGLNANDIEITDYGFLTPKHAATLRELFRNEMLINGEHIQTKPSGCTNEKRIPRIGILNRAGGRNFTNMNDMITTIQKKYPTYEVVFTYFENKILEEQIQFMMGIDILLTPHGAAEYSIIYMPSYQECSSMIEFLPPLYIVPDFFGSLAKASNVQHSFFYMKGYEDEIINDLENHKYHHLLTYEHRDDLQCINIPRMMDALTILVDEWVQCCNNKIKKS
jgi:Glycosyltransferase 61